MVDSIQRRYSYFIAMYFALLVTSANAECTKPVLPENTQVVPHYSNVNLTCPGCHGQTQWSRNNQTMKLQNGTHLILTSFSYEDEDNYTCYRDGAPACTVQVLVKDDIEKPQISCYLRHPTYNITCDWQTTRELRPHAKVILIAWMVDGEHVKNSCSYIPSTRKFTCSTPCKEKDSGRHTMSLCVIGRTDYQTSNVVDSNMDYLVKSDPPINVTVTSLENQPYSLWVSWAPPLPWLNNFYKLEYQVQYQVEGTPHVSNVTTDETFFVIKDALARRRHVVRVRTKEEFFYTWSEWSKEVVGSPWSEELEELRTTTDYFIMTSSEEETSTEEEGPTQKEPAIPPTPIARYLSLVASAIFVIVLLLFLGILMKNQEIKLLKLKGGLLRTLFQPSRHSLPVPAASQPQPGEPLLMAPSPQPEVVTVTAI